MEFSVGGPKGISPSSSLTDALKNKSSTTQVKASSVPEDDAVDISKGSNLDSLRVEAGVLKNDLPGLIAGSLLAPVSESVQRDNPLNSLLTRLVNPATSLLQGTAVDDFSQLQLKAFQGEVETLRQSIPTLAANELLTPFLSSQDKTSSLNGILQSISAELNGLADLVLKKAG